MPYFRIGETVSSARYRWNCQDRGDEPFVILQWTHSGEGVFESRRRRPAPVPADHAFVAVVPERFDATIIRPTQQEPWIFHLAQFLRPIRLRSFPQIPGRIRAGRSAFAPRRARPRPCVACSPLSAQTDSPDRSRISLQAYAFMLEWWREAAAAGRQSGKWA